MAVLYDTVIHGGAAALAVVHRVPKIFTGRGKNRMFVDGQALALRSLAREFRPGARNYWFHCSSLGEYAIARPIIRTIKDKDPECRIALTFFSPTGVNALKSNPGRHCADYVGFLPIDTGAHARALLDIVKPSAAAFMVSEYWPNYLSELHRRHIPTYLISAIFSRRAPHFKHWFGIGKAFRNSLSAYTRIFALDTKSKNNLASLGFDRVTLAGDPLVDNALAVAATPYTDDRLQEFCQGHRVMICGSISDEKDLHICSTVANSHPDRRFIFVPHEVAPSHLHRVEASLTVSSCRMSDYVCGSGQQCNVLIVDHVGSLGLLYRYGAMAYIGGGFTSQLHSIIEATVYGLPAAFGPRTERKVTPDDLCDLGVGTVVTSPLELDTWYTHLHDASDSELWRLRQTAIEYCLAQSGATESIAKTIIDNG